MADLRTFPEALAASQCESFPCSVCHRTIRHDAPGLILLSVIPQPDGGLVSNLKDVHATLCGGDCLRDFARDFKPWPEGN